MARPAQQSQFLRPGDGRLFDTITTELSRDGVVYYKQGNRIALADCEISLAPGGFHVISEPARACAELCWRLWPAEEELVDGGIELVSS